MSPFDKSHLNPIPEELKNNSLNTLILRSSEKHRDIEIQAKFSTGKNALQIGSSEKPQKGNDLILGYPNISRIHAKIERLGESLLITDLGSTNGTIVKGERIEEGEAVSISNNEVISLADIKLAVILK